MTELPEIDGIKPVGVVTKVTGTGQRITRHLHLDEPTLLLVEASCSSANALQQTSDGPKLHQKLKIVDLYEVDRSD